MNKEASVLSTPGAAKRPRDILPLLEVLLLAIAALLPLFVADYLTVFATRVLVLALFSLSFDIIWGYAGILSFGQALFFGSAGYGVAIIARDYGVTSIFLDSSSGNLDRTRRRCASRCFSSFWQEATDGCVCGAWNIGRFVGRRASRSRMVLFGWS